jgi:hypothetical protein
MTQFKNILEPFKRNKERNSSARKLTLFFILGALPPMGVVMLAIGAMNYIPVDNISNPYSYFVTLGYGLLIGGAAYVTGGFIGFLFGLPRYLTNPDSVNKDYSRNDNLIQISDWLTKIIVGLGLTNLHKIPTLLTAFGTRAGILFGATNANSPGAVFAEVLAIYFLVCGFLLGYLWTNIQYIPILTESDKEAKNISDEMTAKEVAANAALDPHTESVNSTDPRAYSKVEQFQKSLGTREKILSFTEFSSLVDIARHKMDKGQKQEASLPRHLQDPNKNQWGGKPESGNRKITGTISPVDDSDLFRIVLTVMSTSISNPMKEGDVVVFSLHPTFPDPFKIVTVKEHTAILEFIAYGAFTVGVLCDDGTTELELNLANLPNVPSTFARR